MEPTTMDCAAAAAADDDYREEESFRNKEALDLDEKTRWATTLRSLSDPCPEEGFLTDTKSTIGDKGGGGGDEGVDFRQKLTLVACEEDKSLEDCYAGIEKGKVGHPGDKGSDVKEELSSSSPSLVRAPSLPPDICRHKAFGEDNTSICVPRRNMPRRQVSLNLSDLRPPRHSSKGMLQSISVRRYRSGRYLDSIKSGKSLTDLECEEVQGFKDLGFSFEDKDMNQHLVGILPGLQEKRSDGAEPDVNSMRRPYLSEAWISQTHATHPIPKWNAKGSPEDMKARIRQWARAVASNVLE